MDGYQENEDEISFPEGAVIDVMQKRLDGWWLVRYEGQTGLVPATFLKKAQNDMVNLQIAKPIFTHDIVLVMIIIIII